MTKRQQKAAEAKAKRDSLHAIIKEAGGSADLDLSKVKAIDGTDREKLDEIRKRFAEVDTLETEVRDLAAAEEEAKAFARSDAEREERAKGDEPGATVRPGPRKSLAQLVMDSGIIKRAIGNNGTHSVRLEDVDPGDLVKGRLKATIQGGTYAEGGVTTAQSYLPEVTREGEIVPYGFQEPMIVDAIPMRATSERAVEYMEQTTRGSAGVTDAVEREEGADYIETTFAWTVRTQPVENIGVIIPVTDEMLQDVPALEGIINDDLVMEVRRRLSSQCINGNGTSPNLRGILNKVGINTTAKGADTPLDAMAKGIRDTEIAGFTMVDRIFIHPTDWWKIRVTKTTTGDYLFGAPDGPGFMMLWGKPRVVTQEIAAGTACLGSSMFARLYSRRGITVEIGLVADNFKKGLKSIRAGCRDSMVVTRAAAWGQVTGL